MMKSSCTDSQIIGILKTNETGAKVSDLCREYSMSQALFYKCHSK